MKQPNERLQSFLRKEIDDIEKTLEPLKGAKADSLRDEINLKKEALESQHEGELPFLVLSSLRKDFVELKERAESLATKPSLLSRIPPPVWLAIIPLLLVIYLAYLAIVQRIERPQILRFATQTAEVVQQTMVPSVAETSIPASPTATP
ncbi:MAG TPA: hypothetical protein VFZ43_05750 [Anaerolineales bacterium]